MSSGPSVQDVLRSLNLNETEQSREAITASGITPNMIKDVSIINDRWILGVTPNTFVKDFSTVEFDFKALETTFEKYCKDYTEALVATTASKAFSAKILFEFGPMMRSEKRGKGDKAIRFRFPYKLEPEQPAPAPVQTQFVIKTVIVSTFKDHQQSALEEGGKMVITMKQATLLAMKIFSKAVDFAYTADQSVLMTPLCGAIFSKTCIAELATETAIEAKGVIKLLNESTCPSGHNLANSDMACAIVAAIAGTKGMANRGGRDQIITKVIKQYSAKHKEYLPARFDAFAKFALGGVPQGLDSGSLIENFKNFQIQARARK